jgi:RNA polymerase-binding protein DksA
MIINKLRRKSSLKEFQGQLEKEKAKLEERLKNLIAPEGVLNELPDFGGEVSDESIEADQIEEIGNVLALKQILEENLKNIDEALERIKNGTYGICRRCQKEIELKRLRVEPAATLCSKCVKKIEKLD